MPASIEDKAVLAFRERRVRIVKATRGVGIAADVVGSRPDPATLVVPVYRAMLWLVGGEMRRSCTCPSPRTTCYHLRALEMLWHTLDTDEVGG